MYCPSHRAKKIELFDLKKKHEWYKNWVFSVLKCHVCGGYGEISRTIEKKKDYFYKVLCRTHGASGKSFKMDITLVPEFQQYLKAEEFQSEIRKLLERVPKPAPVRPQPTTQPRPVAQPTTHPRPVAQPQPITQPRQVTQSQPISQPQPVAQPKPVIQPEPETVGLIVKRGFEISGDSFKFFVRVENPLELLIPNVQVELLLPETLRIDEKLSKPIVHLGDILPKKFKSAIFYFYCLSCSDDNIDAFIKYKDLKGKWNIQNMPTFNISTCKYVKPKHISSSEFDQKFAREEGKNLQVTIKEGISETQVLSKIKERMTMDLIESDERHLNMYGETKDGSDIGLSAQINEISGQLNLIVKLISQNSGVQMGVFSDIIESLRDIKSDTLEIKEDQKAIIQFIDERMEEIENLTVSMNGIGMTLKQLNEQVIKLESSGEFAQAEQFHDQMSRLRTEMKALFTQSDERLEEVAANLEILLERQEITEAYLKEHLGTDWEKVKDYWQQYKEGKIGKKALLKFGLKIAGKGFLKMFRFPIKL